MSVSDGGGGLDERILGFRVPEDAEIGIHAPAPGEGFAPKSPELADPKFLEIEITEGTAMINTDRTVTTMRNLREMGVQISLDDFGTGHSALNYLRSFPIDGVKIDQAFVHEIEASANDRAIVSAVIAMAHGMKLRVTAEGVETQAQFEFLKGEGCEEVQGYLFGRPAAPASP